MSSYQRKTQHPESLHFETAEWLDDYFGNHNYGVRFPSDGKVFRADEFEWEAKIEHAGALVCTHRGGAMTIDQTEKGSRWGAPKQERKDVTVEVNRLDLHEPTEEDKKAGAVISERLAKVAVRCVLIHKPSNDFASFDCKLPEVHRAASYVSKKYLEAHPDAKPEDFVLVEYESHQVRVSTLQPL